MNIVNDFNPLAETGSQINLVVVNISFTPCVTGDLSLY